MPKIDNLMGKAKGLLEAGKKVADMVGNRVKDVTSEIEKNLNTFWEDKNDKGIVGMAGSVEEWLQKTLAKAFEKIPGLDKVVLDKIDFQERRGKRDLRLFEGEPALPDDRAYLVSDDHASSVETLTTHWTGNFVSLAHYTNDTTEMMSMSMNGSMAGPTAVSAAVSSGLGNSSFTSGASGLSPFSSLSLGLWTYKIIKGRQHTLRKTR